MAKNGFKVMDSDMHVIEPADLWKRYIDPAFRDRGPRGIDRWMGDMQLDIDGVKSPPNMPSDAWEASKARELDERYVDSVASNWDSASQVRAMDKEGVDLSVLYPSRGLYALAIDGMDPPLAAAIARAYNRWMHDFCDHAPKRLYGAAMISPFDAETAVIEARRSVQESGLKAIFVRPNIVNGRNWHDPYYDPLWRQIQDLGVPLGFHEGAWAGLPQVGSRFETYMMHHVCCHPMEMMLATVSMIGGGVLERFPDLQVGFLEGNCSWVPWLVWRLDEHFELSGRFESPELKLEPQEYFKRQCYVSIEADEEPARFLEQCGLEHTVVFSTDYPHNDAKYPHALDLFLTMPLSEKTKGKILWDNCARLYGFN